MSKPNILIFMTDQQRGDSVLKEQCLTPNLDQFRKEGVTFSKTFCPSPHCCPSRATFMSGLYPSQHGVWHNVNVTNAITRGLKEGVRLWSEDLADAGYDMSYSGKWHVSAMENPDNRGWKMYPSQDCTFISDPEKRWEFYREKGTEGAKERGPGEILRPYWNPYTHYGTMENPFGDEDVVTAALEVIEKRGETETPWCQFVGTLGPHDPYRVPEEFLNLYNIEDIVLPENFADGMADRPGFYRRTRDIFDQLSEEEHREAIRHYLAFCSYEDALFGQVLEALRKNNQLDNTIIIYTSDHGDYCGEHGLWCKGLPCFQGAYHVPLVVNWAGEIENPGRDVDEYISLADFAPTFLEAAGIQVEREFYGSSLIPFLKNQTPDNWREFVYTQSNGNELYGI